MNGGAMEVALRGFGGLIVVLALVLLIARYARRTGRGQAEQQLQILQRVGLSKEASLAVVEVGGRTLVLGVTAHGVSMLSSLGDGEIDADALAAALADARVAATAPGGPTVFAPPAPGSPSAAETSFAAESPLAPETPVTTETPAAAETTVVPETPEASPVATSEPEPAVVTPETAPAPGAKTEPDFGAILTELAAEAAAAAQTQATNAAALAAEAAAAEAAALEAAAEAARVEAVQVEAATPARTAPDPSPGSDRSSDDVLPDNELGLANALSAFASLAVAKTTPPVPEPVQEPVAATVPAPRHSVPVANWFTDAEPAAPTAPAAPVASVTPGPEVPPVPAATVGGRDLGVYDLPLDLDDDEDELAALLEDELDELDDDEPEEKPEFVPAHHVVLPSSERPAGEPPARDPEPTQRREGGGDRRRPLPAGVDLDAYPDLASALRAAGLTSGGGVPGPRTTTSSGPAAPGALHDALRAAEALGAQSMQDVAAAAATWIAQLPRAEATAAGSVMIRTEAPEATPAADLPTLVHTRDEAPATAVGVSDEPEFELLMREIAQESARAAAEKLAAAERAEAEAAAAVERTEAERLAATETAWRHQLEAARRAHEAYAPQLPAPATPVIPATSVTPATREGWDLLPAATETPAAAKPKKTRPAKGDRPAPTSGSVLSPATWRQGFAALRDLKKD